MNGSYSLPFLILPDTVIQLPVLWYADALISILLNREHPGSFNLIKSDDLGTGGRES